MEYALGIQIVEPHRAWPGSRSAIMHRTYVETLFQLANVIYWATAAEGW